MKINVTKASFEEYYRILMTLFLIIFNPCHILSKCNCKNNSMLIIPVVYFMEKKSFPARLHVP